jgi:outer membrane lipoprotein carrier protein
VLGAWVASAGFAASSPLDRFLDGLNTWQAEFTQQLSDSKGREQSRASGVILVSRPGRFRWEVRPSSSGPVQYSQLLLSDGRNLWFHDRELEQITVKPAAGALNGAPAALLAGGGDWRALFVVRALPRAGGLDWIEVRPRRSPAEFRDARLGFIGAELRRMVLRDNLGQRADIEFQRGQRNPVVPKALLEFTPPIGVDVIGVPVATR